CSQCREGSGEIVAAIDVVVPGAPTVPPSAGFDLHVLAALGVESPDARQHETRRVGRAVSRRVVLAAAAAVVAVIAGLSGALIIAGDAPARMAGGSVALATEDGEQVGTATVGWLDHRRVLVMSVSRPAVGVGYSCRVLRARVVPKTLGRWEASSGDGGTWVVRAPPGDLTEVQLVTDSGQVWSSASLP
ncbi:MAG: hypothetical protein ACRDOY_10985, partial [Nocardioidaceae bacterium]